MEPSLQAAAVSAGLVAVLCGAIAIAAWRTVMRTGNRRIQLVVAAFVVLALKNLAKSVHLATGQPESGALELLFSLCDVTAVALIAWPMLVPRRV